MGVALIELVLVGVAAPVTGVLAVDLVGFWVLVGLVKVFGLLVLVASVLEVEVVIGI